MHVCRRAVLSQTCSVAQGWQLGDNLTERTRKWSLEWLGMAQCFLLQENVCKTLPPDQCWRETLSGRLRADAGALYFTILWGCCSVQKSCSASSPGLRSGAVLSTEENWHERSFCHSWVPVLWQLAGTVQVPVVPRALLTASPKCFSSIWGLQDILQLLYPWRKSPKPLPPPQCPLLVSFKQNHGETSVFSEGEWTHS